MTDQLAPMDFPEEGLTEVSVTIGEKSYVLKGASGSAATTWRNAKGDTLQIRGEQVVGTKSIANADPLLLSLCLYNDQVNLVPLKTILSWKDKIQKDLVERLLLISDLSMADNTVESLEKEREELDKRIVELRETAKNDLTSTEDGSE